MTLSSPGSGRPNAAVTRTTASPYARTTTSCVRRGWVSSGSMLRPGFWAWKGRAMTAMPSRIVTPVGLQARHNTSP